MATSSTRGWFLFLDDPVGVLFKVKADKSTGAENRDRGERDGRRIQADL